MVSDQMSAPSDQTPTPPLARTSKATSTTEKVSKLLKLSDPQIDEEASLMSDAAKAGLFPNKKISVAAWGNQRNLSKSMTERVYIRSLLQKQDYELVYDVDNSATDDKRPYVNPRGTILSYYWIKKFNETVPADQRLPVGQRLDVVIENGSFILTPGI